MKVEPFSASEAAIAFAPIAPAVPFVVQHPITGEATMRTFSSGVALVDVYFAAALQGILSGPLVVPGCSSQEYVDIAWLIAIEAIRQRPKIPKPPTAGDNGEAGRVVVP